MDNLHLECIESIHRKFFSEPIRLLHSGGCGISAYLMCLELRKLGLPAKIICGDDYGNPAKKYENLISNRKTPKKSVNYISGSHFFIELGIWHFDAMNFVYSNHFTDLTYYTIPQMRLAIAKGNWRQVYDKRQNKKLYEYISSSLKQFSCLTKQSE